MSRTTEKFNKLISGELTVVEGTYSEEGDYFTPISVGSEETGESVEIDNLSPQEAYALGRLQERLYQKE
jgi:hypothetical protein